MGLERAVHWRSRLHGGIEDMHLSEDSNGTLRVRSVIVGQVASRPVGVSYELAIDPDWRTRLLEVRRNDGVALHLHSDGRGGWRDDRGVLPELEGCLDVDFEMTPFTNTLPIRRSGLRIGESRQFSMAYVPADTLRPFVDMQIYTRLADRRYRYEEADGSFSAELTVDEDGLVLDYPGLFERV